MKKILLLAAFFLFISCNNILAQAKMSIINGTGCSSTTVTLYANNGSGCSDLVTQVITVPSLGTITVGTPVSVNNFFSCGTGGTSPVSGSSASSCASASAYWTYAVVSDGVSTPVTVGIPSCASPFIVPVTLCGNSDSTLWSSSPIGLEVEIHGL